MQLHPAREEPDLILYVPVCIETRQLTIVAVSLRLTTIYGRKDE